MGTNTAQMKIIVQTEEFVTLLGGGALLEPDLAEALAIAPILVAADGGADAALENGYKPDAVIGDFDSLSDATRSRLPAERLHLIAEQETTDFEKALQRIVAPLVVAIGFTGARLDHELAAMNTIVRHSHRPVLLVGSHDVAFAAPPKTALSLPNGTRLSLFPLAQTTGQSEGLLWPIEGLKFAPDGPIGTSNQVTGPVRLAFEAPGMLVLVPRSRLTAVIKALQVTEYWPSNLVR